MPERVHIRAFDPVPSFGQRGVLGRLPRAIDRPLDDVPWLVRPQAVDGLRDLDDGPVVVVEDRERPAGLAPRGQRRRRRKRQDDGFRRFLDGVGNHGKAHLQAARSGREHERVVSGEGEGPVGPTRGGGSGIEREGGRKRDGGCPGEPDGGAHGPRPILDHGRVEPEEGDPRKIAFLQDGPQARGIADVALIAIGKTHREGLRGLPHGVDNRRDGDGRALGAAWFEHEHAGIRLHVGAVGSTDHEAPPHGRALGSGVVHGHAEARRIAFLDGRSVGDRNLGKALRVDDVPLRGRGSRLRAIMVGDGGHEVLDPLARHGIRKHVEGERRVTQAGAVTRVGALGDLVVEVRGRGTGQHLDGDRDGKTRGPGQVGTEDDLSSARERLDDPGGVDGDRRGGIGVDDGAHADGVVEHGGISGQEKDLEVFVLLEKGVAQHGDAQGVRDGIRRNRDRVGRGDIVGNAAHGIDRGTRGAVCMSDDDHGGQSGGTREGDGEERPRRIAVHGRFANGRVADADSRRGIVVQDPAGVGEDAAGRVEPDQAVEDDVEAFVHLEAGVAADVDGNRHHRVAQVLRGVEQRQRVAARRDGNVVRVGNHRSAVHRAPAERDRHLGRVPRCQRTSRVRIEQPHLECSGTRPGIALMDGRIRHDAQAWSPVVVDDGADRRAALDRGVGVAVRVGAASPGQAVEDDAESLGAFVAGVVEDAHPKGEGRVARKDQDRTRVAREVASDDGLARHGLHDGVLRAHRVGGGVRKADHEGGVATRLLGRVGACGVGLLPDRERGRREEGGEQPLEGDECTLAEVGVVRRGELLRVDLSVQQHLAGQVNGAVGSAERGPYAKVGGDGHVTTADDHHGPAKELACAATETRGHARAVGADERVGTRSGHALAGDHHRACGVGLGRDDRTSAIQVDALEGVESLCEEQCALVAAEIEISVFAGHERITMAVRKSEVAFPVLRGVNSPSASPVIDRNVSRTSIAEDRDVRSRRRRSRRRDDGIPWEFVRADDQRHPERRLRRERHAGAQPGTETRWPAGRGRERDRRCRAGNEVGHTPGTSNLEVAVRTDTGTGKSEASLNPTLPIECDVVPRGAQIPQHLERGVERGARTDREVLSHVQYRYRRLVVAAKRKTVSGPDVRGTQIHLIAELDVDSAAHQTTTGKSGSSGELDQIRGINRIRQKHAVRRELVQVDRAMRVESKCGECAHCGIADRSAAGKQLKNRTHDALRRNK